MLHEKREAFYIKVQKVNTKFRNGHKIVSLFSYMLFLDKRAAYSITNTLLKKSIQHKKLFIPEDKTVNRPDFFHVEGFAFFVVI